GSPTICGLRRKAPLKAQIIQVILEVSGGRKLTSCRCRALGWWAVSTLLPYLHRNGAFSPVLRLRRGAATLRTNGENMEPMRAPFVLSVAQAKSKHEHIDPAGYTQIWSRRGTTAVSTSKLRASEEGWVAPRATQRWDAFYLSQPTTALQLSTGVHHLNVDT